MTAGADPAEQRVCMDGCRVLSVSGEGSSGRALLVQQESSNRMFAMKEIRLPRSLSDTRISRKEAVLLAKMKHPNIVAFKESFEGKYEFPPIHAFLNFIQTIRPLGLS